MKRIFAILIAAVMLCLSFSVSVMAEEEKPLWVTHYNDNTAEGAGTIFTSDYSGAGWWIHFAFAPTDVENVYEIVDSSNGLSDGNALALAVPEGGFVWAANTGNDYPALGLGDTDFTSDGCSNCINDVLMNWMVGTLVKFNGLDLDGLTVPTSTPDVKWYDDAYVCTATYSLYDGEANVGGESEEESTEAPAESTDASTEESTVTSTATSEATSTATSTATSEAASAAESVADDEEGGLGTGAIIAIIVAAVAVIGAVVFIVVKKK